MSILSFRSGVVAVFAVVTITAGCGELVDDYLDKVVNRPPPRADGGLPPPRPDAGPSLPPIDAGPPLPPRNCVNHRLPAPLPGMEQCPRIGSNCAGSLPPALPCRIEGRGAIVACQSPPGRPFTWQVLDIECPVPPVTPPICIPGLGVPPSAPQCPPAGSTCAIGDSPLFCNIGKVGTLMTCPERDAPSFWRIDFQDCP